MIGAPEATAPSRSFHPAYPIADWFLLPATDIRSSHALEVAMKEFECHGFDLDYLGLAWGDDLTIAPDGPHWAMCIFMCATWRDICTPVKQQ
ncbi:MAG: DNA/RNA helicase domain-containing protein [Candidatus Rokuibacteriota bacterium]